MKIYIPLYQFIILAVSTAVMTYFFNHSIMSKQYLWAGFLGIFLLRNLYSSYQLSRFIRILEAQNKQDQEK